MTEPAQTDWIEWSGGECPVAPETLVEVELADGGPFGPQRAAIWSHGFEGDSWKRKGVNPAFYIRRYRLSVRP